jgi:hypothetical protein
MVKMKLVKKIKKYLSIRKDSPYGEQHDLFVPNTFIRCSLKGEMKIFFRDGIPPVHVPRDTAIYNQLIKNFNLMEGVLQK